MAWSRTGVAASALAAIAIVGSVTGAQLGMDRQKQQSIKKFREVEPAEQIAMLENRRQVLLSDKAQLQRKLDVFLAKVQRQKEEEEARQRREAKPV